MREIGKYKHKIFLIVALFFFSSCLSGQEINSQDRSNSIYVERFEEYLSSHCDGSPGIHNWEGSYTEEDHLRFTWMNYDTGSLVIFTYYRKPTDINTGPIYKRENFHLFFDSYENVQEVTSCHDKSGEILLFELTGKANDTTYPIRFWTFSNIEEYFFDITLVVPPEVPDLMDFYSEQFIPEHISCLES